jgi:iron complex transport system substrate-binding protein
MHRCWVLALVLLAGCGTGGGSADGSGGEATASAGEGAFPTKVEHKYGTTTVPVRPRRIVSVGLTEQDTILALGYKPIATTEWYGEQPYFISPLSLPYVLERLTPQLEAAVAGKAPRKVVTP